MPKVLMSAYVEEEELARLDKYLETQPRYVNRSTILRVAMSRHLDKLEKEKGN